MQNGSRPLNMRFPRLPLLPETATSNNHHKFLNSTGKPTRLQYGTDTFNIFQSQKGVSIFTHYTVRAQNEHRQHRLIEDSVSPGAVVPPAGTVAPAPAPVAPPCVRARTSSSPVGTWTPSVPGVIVARIVVAIPVPTP